MNKLHFLPGGASFTPHVLLHELGLPVQLVAVDRAAATHKSPAYLALNPNGLVPVLEQDGLVLYETAAIVLHLVDTHPQAALAPAVGSIERAHFYKWLVWLSATLQSQMTHYFYPDRMARPGDEQGAAAVKAAAEARIASLVDQIETHLAQATGPWMMGERFSALDPYAFMLCRWTRNMKRPARTLPHIASFLQRVFERPATQRAFADEGLALPAY